MTNVSSAASTSLSAQISPFPSPLKFPDNALAGVVCRLPSDEPWPAYVVEYHGGDSGTYCAPCLRRIMARLQSWEERGWTKRESWNFAEDMDQISSPHDCRHCGRVLIQHLSAEGVEEELAYFEELPDRDLAATNVNDIQRLSGGLFVEGWRRNPDRPLARRTREVLLRYLRSRGTPFDPFRHGWEG